MLNIRTDNKFRDLVSWIELPEKWQKEFAYVADEDRYSPRFVKYKGQYYDTCDTQRITTEGGAFAGWAMQVKPDDPLAKWHAIASDSFFSGMVFKFDEDFEKVVVGVYTS